MKNNRLEFALNPTAIANKLPIFLNHQYWRARVELLQVTEDLLSIA